MGAVYEVQATLWEDDWFFVKGVTTATVQRAVTAAAQDQTLLPRILKQWSAVLN